MMAGARARSSLESRASGLLARDLGAREHPPVMDDRHWDAFVETSTVAHYRQSAAWARFRRSAGWRSQRIALHEGSRVVAGLQLLTRPLPGFGAVAYVQNAPVTSQDDVTALRGCLDELMGACRDQRVLYVALLPGSNESWYLDELHARGFAPSTRFASPTATVRLDLARDTDDLLAAMQKSTRANVRRGLTRGLTVRDGTEADLSTFYDLLAGAAARKGFAIRPARYYLDLHRCFSQDDRVKFLLVERGDEPVAAQLSLLYGETFHSAFMAWSGRYADRKPNHLLEWTAITWAKEEGFRYYDFEGVDIAATVGDAGHRRTDDWVSPYKLSYGGEVVALPPTLELIPNRLARRTYYSVVTKLENVSMAATLRKRFVRRAAGRDR
jgi:lipid II:glycine glycyltransferase (peptidoglycan interpeptide bridge formation enzyme)